MTPENTLHRCNRRHCVPRTRRLARVDDRSFRGVTYTNVHLFVKIKSLEYHFGRHMRCQRFELEVPRHAVAKFAEDAVHQEKSICGDTGVNTPSLL